ncbi:hypothetical protein F5X68DRAFT_199174, partial [Plectosphaerella plurivora]
ETFVQILAERNEWMTYHVPDFKSEEGRSIPYVHLSTSQLPSAWGEATSANSTSKLRVWIQGGVHGNEPGGDQAVLAFLGKLDADPEWALSLLEKVDFMILPRYSPDGVSYFQRFLATSFDPNRDHIKLHSQQTRDIKKLNREFNAHVALDCHEYAAGVSSTIGPNGEYLSIPDNMFSHFKNPNVHKDIRQLGESLFVPTVHSAIENNNLTVGPYVVVQDPKGMRLTDFVTDARGDVAVFLGQGIALLSETRGIGIGEQTFKRRTAAGLVAIETVAQIAADNAEEIYKVVEEAREDFITNDQEIIVTDAPRWTNVTWEFFNATTGDIVEVPVLFGNNTPPASNLTRARPEAYVFSRAWAEVAELLRVSGIRVDEIPSAFTGEVEAYNVTGASLATTKYEGTALTTITTEIINKTISFPPGAYYVSTRQQNAAQAFLRLEPEGPDSFATFNILPVSVGDEYQVYRIRA